MAVCPIMSDHQAMPASGIWLPMRSRWVRSAQLRTLVRSISSIQPDASGGVTGEQETEIVFTSSGRMAASIITLIPPLLPPTTCARPPATSWITRARSST
ncbi:hypothetical protein D3C83_70000 [compost metagenome]